MNDKIKKIICAVIFLAIAGLITWRINSICRYSSWTSVENGHLTYSNLKKLAQYPIDVVAFGSSHCNRSFAAPELYGQYGMSAYNIGGSWQPLMVSYYLLKELLKHENPKAVVIDVYRLFWNSKVEKEYRVGFDALPLSSLKLEAINELNKLEISKSKMSYIFNILKYHSTWKNLNELGFFKINETFKAEYYQGFRKNTGIYKATKEQASFSGWESTGDKKTELVKIEYEYISKIIELCKSKNIPVILYKDPCCNWKPEQYNAVKSYADSVGVPYIDFHTQKEWQEIGFDFSKDLADAGHDNTRGAIKVTRYLGKFLHENYNIPDRRGDSKYKGLEADYARWQREIFSEKFVFENNMSAYLDILLKDKPKDYTVIFSVKDNCQAKMEAKIKSQLKELGFKSDKVFDEYGHSFIGIWQNGKIIYERRSETIDNKEKDLLELKNRRMPDGTKYYVSSAGWRCGNISKIIINGKDHSKNSRGFNIVVYDNQTHRIVDSICWDTHKDAGITYKR